MRTYRMTKAGSLDDLKIVDEAVPVPGPGQVLIRVRATALNFRDLALLTGMIPAPVKPDVVPLSDAAGEIEAVGPGVTRFAPGDRVINSFFPEWFGGGFNGVSAAAQYSLNVDGWLTEYKVVGAETVVRAPDGLSFEQAAALVCSGVTAWTALAGVRAGDIVLTQGTGGVSIFAVQIAKALGARVIATTSSTDKADRLHALGADEVIRHDTDPEWGAMARAMTEHGVDRVVDTVGAATFSQSLKAVAAGGQVSMVGVLGGFEGGVDYLSMFLSYARFQGITTGSRRDLEDLVRFVERTGLKPMIDRRFSFDDARAAIEHLGRRQVFGKVVIEH
ncbi:NAD(P)-dependent alcohol dehydrogenase [Sphingomonas sp. 2R-10]|uniref:zinc-dependent alcohol dehydrogenase family protein n=1 Tax=Sphingomonas sp. 2R-10 TaxID=3045148 RepID=UPI000F77D9EF|nr:NAD(P)-dependent alcohol dehydrogenase [Sphingomonas sp. 2R-10]MDJ0276439.1 NAD(P)-dependent alcohol dehydrogenase [Sphingomonas sp. 2R-10]